MGKTTPKFLGNPTLETDRLTLRRLTMADVHDVFEYARDPEVARFVAWEAHKSLQETKTFINWTLERYRQDEAGEWGIELNETGRIIGAMGFVRIDWPNYCGAIGYALSKEYWGQGMITEAVSRLIHFSFKDMKLNRIEAHHIPENKASGRVMQKVGMQYEGLIRQRLLVKGEYCNVMQYAAVRADWAREK